LEWIPIWNISYFHRGNPIESFFAWAKNRYRKIVMEERKVLVTGETAYHHVDIGINVEIVLEELRNRDCRAIVDGSITAL